jgi:uncharacterized protein with NRDE domain
MRLTIWQWNPGRPFQRPMCLILIAHDVHPQYSLIIAANRDEFYDRPTAPAGYWQDMPSTVGGRDLQKGGTWMATSGEGRLAGLTNFRNPRLNMDDAPSRGELTTEFVNSDVGIDKYCESLKPRDSEFNGFTLLLGSRSELKSYSNRTGIVDIGKGIFGLSNGAFDAPWPKVLRGKQLLAKALKLTGEEMTGALLEVLKDRTQPEDSELPETGVGLDFERVLAPIFIASPAYGTRSSSVVLFSRDGHISFAEQTFCKGLPDGDLRVFDFQSV